MKPALTMLGKTRIAFAFVAEQPGRGVVRVEALQRPRGVLLEFLPADRQRGRRAHRHHDRREQQGGCILIRFIVIVLLSPVVGAERARGVIPNA